MDVLFAFFSPGPMELMIILLIGVLLFGKRLPEVGRSLGKGIVEFKKGVRGIEDELDSATSLTAARPHREDADDHDTATAPKFEPPTAEPTMESAGHRGARPAETPGGDSPLKSKPESGQA